MSRLLIGAGIACVVLSVAAVRAQEPIEAHREPVGQEIHQLRGEVSELTIDVRRLEARLEALENLLRELVRERREISDSEAMDTPLEEIRLVEPLSRGDLPYEMLVPGLPSKKAQWQRILPEEVDAWIRRPFRPGPDYHWDTFPAPPSPPGQ